MNPQLAEIVNRVWHIDCLEGMAMLPAESVDLAVIDPPYGINFYSNWRKPTTALPTSKGIANDQNNDVFLSTVIDRLQQSLRNNTCIYWFTRWDKVGLHVEMLNKYWRVKNSLIWLKNNKGSGDLGGAYAGQYENIIFAHKGRRVLNEVDGTKRHTDVLQFPRIASQKLLHSHQKPVELIEFLIKKSSNEGDTVLVPFAGSGSECVAAINTGRNFVSFELDEHYVDIANQRVEEAIESQRQNKV